MKRSSILIALLVCSLAYQPAARAQSGNGNISHLTIYSAGIGEFLEERTLQLQPGLNTLEWRSLMPRANIRTVRVLERRVVNYRDKNNENQDKLVTRVEVVLSNCGSKTAEAFVREGIERYDDNQWKIVESTVPDNERLGANTVQFKLNVPAGGKVTLIYTVECE
jgi:hypothetical protein